MEWEGRKSPEAALGMHAAPPMGRKGSHPAQPSQTEQGRAGGGTCLTDRGRRHSPHPFMQCHPTLHRQTKTDPRVMQNMHLCDVQTCTSKHMQWLRTVRYSLAGLFFLSTATATATIGCLPRQSRRVPGPHSHSLTALPFFDATCLFRHITVSTKPSKPSQPSKPRFSSFRIVAAATES